MPSKPKALTDRILAADRAVLAAMTDEHLERLAAAGPPLDLSKVPDEDLELIAAGGPLPARLRWVLEP